MSRIQVSVRIQSLGRTIQLKVDPAKDINEVKDRILSNQQLQLPRQDKEGNVYKYFFTSKKLGKQITGSLASSGVTEGETIILMAEAIAG